MKKVKRQIEQSQAMAEADYISKTGVKPGVFLPSRVGVKVSVEAEKLNKEQIQKIEEYKAKRYKELDNFKKDLNGNTITNQDETELLAEYKYELRRSFNDREVFVQQIIE